MLGHRWNGEEYILGYNPDTPEIFDIGLNTQIGQKWLSKAWPNENWEKLEKILKNKGLKVSRQDKTNPEILTSLNHYMDWIDSCKIIVSNDSLGMHLGIALKKHVLALFGPTAYKEVQFYGKGKALIPNNLPECMPCFKGKCEKELNPSCLVFITPEEVAKEIFDILGIA